MGYKKMGCALFFSGDSNIFLKQEPAAFFCKNLEPFVFDKDRYLAYRGQLDDSRPSNGKPVTGADLRGSIDSLLAGKTVDSNQRPSIGCNIKWIPGNEPEYFTGIRAAEE